MNKKLPPWNLLNKFIFFVFLISVLPLLITGASYYYVSRNTLRDNTAGFIHEVVNNQADYLTLQLRQIEDLIRNISGVDVILNSLAANEYSEDAFTRLSTHAEIGYILNNYSSLEGLVSIDIFSNGDAHYHVGDTLNVTSINIGLKDQIYQETLDSNKRIVWLGVEENVNLNSSHQNVVSAASTLNSISRDGFTLEPIGLLIVNFSTDYFYDYFSNVDLGDNAYLLVVDAKGRYIYHPDKLKIGTLADSDLLQQTGDPSGTFEMDHNDEPMFVVYEHLTMNDWLIMSFVPVENLLKGTATIQSAVISSIIILVILIALTGGLVSSTIVAPIREITSRFRAAQTGGEAWYQEKLPRSNQSDEIGELTQWFNVFVDNYVAKQQTEAILQERTIELEAANQQLTKEIEERRKAESEVLALNATLEERVESRTAQLEDVVKELEAFSYSVSHDLRAPLRAITGFSELLQEDYGPDLDADIVEYLTRISCAGQKMDDLINGLLLLSRLGQNELVLEELDIAVMAKDVFGELIENQTERVFETDFHACHHIVADQHLVTILLTNLFSNAIKFTRDQETAKIEFGSIEEQGQSVCYLRDNGVGFDMKFSDKLFGTFQRLHDESYEGTGIGLAIVKRIILRHNGNIWVESEKGKGTTFYFTLGN